MENNTTIAASAESSGIYAPFEWLFITTALIGVVVNIGTVVALSGWQLISSKTANILLIHQCVADGLSSFLAIIGWISTAGYTVSENILGDIICFLWCYEFVMWAVVQVSINNLFVFTGERYLSVLHPIIHRRLNKRHLAVTLLLSWVHAILVTIGIPFACKREGDSCVTAVTADPISSFVFFVVNEFFFFVFPIIALVVFNMRIIRFLRRPAIQSSTRSQNSGHDAVSKELTITVGIAGAGFLILVTPDAIISILITFNLYPVPVDSFLYYFPTYLMSLTFIMNPLVYILRMPAFKRRFRQLCTRLVPRDESAATASTNIQSTAAS